MTHQVGVVSIADHHLFVIGIGIVIPSHLFAVGGRTDVIPSLIVSCIHYPLPATVLLRCQLMNDGVLGNIIIPSLDSVLPVHTTLDHPPQAGKTPSTHNLNTHNHQRVYSAANPPHPTQNQASSTSTTIATTHPPFPSTCPLSNGPSKPRATSSGIPPTTSRARSWTMITWKKSMGRRGA